MIITKAELEAVAVKASQYPADILPEIAFAGRSNVGKSSLLNLLTGRKSLARVSQSPGKTRTINFYRVNDIFRIVDLPGYGYAKVSRTATREWGPMMEEYFSSRRGLKKVVQLVDIRHAPSAQDVQMYEYLRHYGLDGIVVATKAGHDMWPGPYGEWGSRKNLIASLDQSLRRMRLDYVDIFYSHRPDPLTPMEETMQALVDIVRQGKALYVGISKYPPEMAAAAYGYLREQHVPCLVYQGRYNMIDRAIEDEIIPQAASEGAGFVAFSPLAQGLLTGKYLHGVPSGSRMTHSRFLKPEVLTPELLARISAWNDEAAASGLTLAQYALRWVLRRDDVTSVIVGASSVEQLKSNLAAL